MDNQVPDMFVLSPDQRVCYGAIRTATDITKDIRFNTASEISFKITEKVYDTLSSSWITNPAYNHLEKYNLLYCCDNKSYFRFPKRGIRTDYGIKSSSQFAVNYGRSVQSGAPITYENIQYNGSNNGVLTGFSLQPETDLHHISVVGGYPWWNLSTLDEHGFHHSNSWSHYNQVACDTFIPITAYDVIAVKTRSGGSQSGGAIRYYRYEVWFYDDANPNRCLGAIDIYSGYTVNGNSSYSRPNEANPVFRFNIDSLSESNDLTFVEANLGVSSNATAAEKLKAFKDKLKDGGYIRVDVLDSHADDSASISTKRNYSSFSYTEDNKHTIGWSFPYDGWCVIFSGNRFCTSIDNSDETGTYDLPLHWFVIYNVEEEYDGEIKYKTVSAYSYEYTLSYRTISLSEDTIPLYIPPQILNTVNNSNWVIDKASGSSSVKTGRQYMSEGLLNQVLKILPGWSIGHISSKLMTRYRKVEDTDNANIYSFLMNDIEQLYQCYFVFDSDNKKINAYTQEDIINNSGTNVVLNWQNALQSLTISDVDDSTLTTMRIHTADDTYGLGLVIPTGNGNIYNFQSVIDHMDFVADTTDDPANGLDRNIVEEDGVTRYRTLKEAAELLMEFCENPMVTSSGWLQVKTTTSIGNGDTVANVYNEHAAIYIRNLSEYRNVAEKFIQLNLERIQIASTLSIYYANYKAVIDKIKVRAESAGKSNYYNEEVIRTPSALYSYYTSTVDNANSFISQDLYNEVYCCAVDYHQARAEYEAKDTDYRAYYKVLKTMAARYNLDYNRQIELINLWNTSSTHWDSDGNYIMLSLLTPNEIKALRPYLREGDWTNDNSVFSENYDAKDIITTLSDVYTQAKFDMDTFISKVNYDFETSVANLAKIPEMEETYESLKVGETIAINTVGDTYVIPILLELHINYSNPDDFTMKFTTDYNRKLMQFRYSDLYNSISRISVSDSTFTFSE